MYDLAGIVGSTACRVLDGMLLFGCQSPDEMIVAGFTLITMTAAGAITVMVARTERPIG